jgi:DNA-binding CsgD family transcriptional regulator
MGAIEAVLDAARNDVGGAILLEGHAGMGKTRLHEAALDLARASGMRVLRAAGSDLEQTIAFGVARQLLTAMLIGSSAARHDSVLAGAPMAVREMAGIAGGAQPNGADGDLALAHGLFTALATADGGRPALIAIDDLHWSDSASLELVLYLLRRLDELPVAIVMTQRPVIGGGSSDLLDRIAAHPLVRVERLGPLGPKAIEQLVRQVRDSADDGLVAACARVTAGNPFYLRELLRALAVEGELDNEQLTNRALSLAPDAVARSLRVRIGRLGASAAALARALAILGDDVPLRHTAALAGLPIEQAAVVADRLAAVEIILAREPLRFVHPLVRHTVELDIPASERAGRHLDAGRLLHTEGDDPERVAAHLLLGRAEGNAWVVAQLRAAAMAARRRGSSRSAARYLERALAEPPQARTRPDVLAELGTAEAAAGITIAADRLEAAAAALTDPCRRAELALRQGHALHAQGRHEDAARTYERGLAELDDVPGEPRVIELQNELQTGFTATAAIANVLHGEAVERSDQLLARAIAEPVTRGQRLLLAQAAVRASFAAAPASQVVDLAARAWDDGRLVDREVPDEIAWTLVAGAFGLAGELERSIAIVDTVLDYARRRSLPLVFATASYVRALPRLLQGAVDDAIADLELARSARRYGWRQFVRAAASSYCLCLIEAGELDRAEQVLFEDAPLEEPRDLEDIQRLYGLSELRLAQGRPRDAYDAALATGKALAASAKVFGYCPWRDTAAQAALALGDTARALELARDSRAIAEQTGVMHARVRALRVHGLCEEDERGLELLRRAVELGSDGPPRLETIRALIEFGSALRRANQRSVAREPLQRAADMAKRGGANTLYERARTELRAAGGRPRRELVLRGTASLTPSERRIAELASSGRSNPDIARALFVTPKTVEYHLRNVYRKLDISRRQDLPEALARP